MISEKEADAFLAQRAEDLAVVRGTRERNRGPFTEPLWKDDGGNLLTIRNGETRYVMVQFEKPLMDLSAEIVCRHGGDVLNVGYGLGFVDNVIARCAVQKHVIVEAHATVLDWMRTEGWMGRDNVEVIDTRWEDVNWSKHAGRFDGIIFDPFPFEARTVGGEVWRAVVQTIIKPGGVLVLYGPHLTDDDAARTAAGLGSGVRVERHACTVEVPFVVPEWEKQGVGRHQISVFALVF